MRLGDRLLTSDLRWFPSRQPSDAVPRIHVIGLMHYLIYYKIMQGHFLILVSDSRPNCVKLSTPCSSKIYRTVSERGFIHPTVIFCPISFETRL